MGKKIITAGDVFGEWTLTSKLDQGGNGEVWEASSETGQSGAIKFLRRQEAEPYQRFCDEVEVMERYKDVSGVLPILQRELPTFKSDGVPWYAMPLAVPSLKFLDGMEPKAIVRHFVALADTLSELHSLRISHRDIKPANILALDGRLYLSDFGLVKYPGKKGLTPDKRDVGPKFTMAPEMRRIAKDAEGLPADVYSFAKSLWIALTRVELGFDGQYTATSSLSLSSKFPKLYTTTLDTLLSECTSNEPSLRPTINQVRSRLAEWLAIVSDFSLQNEKQWEELLERIFPHGAPTRVEWTVIDSIIEIINEVGKVSSLNHMFYPGGGGNTITAAARAGETGFMELSAIGTTVLKPRKLTFESFGGAAEWNYLRLEAEQVEPTGEYEVEPGDYHEYLTELEPGIYAHPSVWEYRWERDDTEPLPITARLVVRYLKGTFVIFSTSSPYNQDSSTYDARHETLGEDAFRNYIARNAAEFSRRTVRRRLAEPDLSTA